VPLDTKKAYVQVEAVGSADVAEWLYGIVRANMVFLFKSELVRRLFGAFLFIYTFTQIIFLKNTYTSNFGFLDIYATFETSFWWA
jgi:hypothetical protein